MKKRTKIESKSVKNRDRPKKREKWGLGDNFFSKYRTFDDFGVPGASPGEALGRILGDKFRGEKNDEKKVWKLIASAGHADPGQDPPAGFLRQGSARLRSPGGRGAGGLFALRVTRRGHLEAWRLGGFEPKFEDWRGRYLNKLRTLERLGDRYCA